MHTRVHVCVCVCVLHFSHASSPPARTVLTRSTSGDRRDGALRQACSRLTAASAGPSPACLSMLVAQRSDLSAPQAPLWGLGKPVPCARTARPSAEDSDSRSGSRGAVEDTGLRRGTCRSPCRPAQTGHGRFPARRALEPVFQDGHPQGPASLGRHSRPGHLDPPSPGLPLFTLRPTVGICATGSVT